MIAQAVAEKVATHEDHRQQHGRYKKRPGRAFHVADAGVDECSQRSLRLLHTEPEKAQEGLDENCLGNRERRVHDDDAEEVRRDVTHDDAPRADARQPRRGDELAFAQAERLSAHDARHVQPVHGTDRHEDEQKVSLEGDHEQDDEEDEGQRIQRIDEAHHHGIDSPAGKAGNRAIGDADHEADQACDDGDRQRDANAHHRAHEQVAAEVVGAEQVRILRARRSEYAIEVRRHVLVRTQDRTDHGRNGNDREQCERQRHRTAHR
jgi:hypothetical protein